MFSNYLARIIMKRKSKQKKLTINQPTKLFLEDIEQIYSIVNETMDSVSIENEDFEFENLQDLLEIKSSSLTNIRLVGYKNGRFRIFFSVYPRLIYISIEEDEPALVGTIEKVKEIIGARKRSLLLPIRFLTVLAFLGLVLSFLGLFFRSLPAFQGVISIVYNIFVLLLIYLSKNQIILTYSKNTPSFWKRNSDNIIVAIITSILTLIIGYVFGKITGFIP